MESKNSQISITNKYSFKLKLLKYIPWHNTSDNINFKLIISETVTSNNQITIEFFCDEEDLHSFLSVLIEKGVSTSYFAIGPQLQGKIKEDNIISLKIIGDVDRPKPLGCVNLSFDLTIDSFYLQFKMMINSNKILQEYFNQYIEVFNGFFLKKKGQVGIV